MVNLRKPKNSVTIVAIAALAAGIAACEPHGGDATDAGGGDAGDTLPLCGESSMSIRYAFPGHALVDACAVVTGFGVTYQATGDPAAPTSHCTLLYAGAGVLPPIDVPDGRLYWQFLGYGSDWYARAGRVAIGLDTDLVVSPGDCPPPPGGGAGGSCNYSSHAAEGGGCRFEVRRAGRVRSDREEVVLAEPCTLIYGSDPSQPAPTIAAMHVQAPIVIQTLNGTDPSQPPPFECPR